MQLKDIKFPVHIEEGVSMVPNQGRFILRDSLEQRVGVFFDMPPSVARSIVSVMNYSLSAQRQYAENARSKIAARLDAAAAVATTAAADVSAAGVSAATAAPPPVWQAPEATNFPSWMGEWPRRGSNWTSAEMALLIDAYKNGVEPSAFAKIVGRDIVGVEYRLAKELGHDYQKCFGQALPKPAAVNPELAALFEALTFLFSQLRN